MIGQSFAPLGDPNNPTRQQDANGQTSNPVQEAIKLLQLRMPRVLGAGAPAAPELLNSPGSSLLPPGNPLTDILRKLFGPPMTPSAPMAAPSSMPPPMPPSGSGSGWTPAPAPPPAPAQSPAPMPSPTSLKPKFEYIPNDTYTPPDTEIRPPMTTGGRRVYSV